MQRKPRQKSNKHLDFVRSLPCAVCLNNIQTEAAHVRMSDATIGKTEPGIGQKPHDQWTVPLCSSCHRRQHQIGEKQFWGSMDPIKLALICAAFDPDAEQVEFMLRAHRLANPSPFLPGKVA